MQPGADTRTPADAPSTSPGTALLISTLALCAAFGGWWSRGRVEVAAPAGPSAEVVEPGEEGAPPPPAKAAAAAPPAGTARGDGGPPDIVLVTVGALRADRAGLLGGHGRDTMPFLAELARDRGVSFRAAVAPSSWALPSAASVLTGQPPSGHGILAPPKATAPDAVEVQVLPDDVATLAERLSRAGYQTRAVVADPSIARATGLGRGFDEYVNVGFARAQRVQLVVERFGVERKKAKKPSFVWVHYSDPTAPYTPNPWAFFWGPIEGSGVPSATEADLLLLSKGTGAQLASLVQPGPRAVALETLYDSEIRLIDDSLQLLWGDLGIGAEDLVVVAGLHGEELLDHGGLGHGHTLFEELVRVPLVVSWPERWTVPQRITEPVSLADLMPTIAEAAGVPFRAKGKVPSRSLVPLIEGVERAAGPRISAELGTSCRAMYDGTYKVIALGPPPLTVYDLDADPGEQEALGADDPASHPVKAAFVAEAVTPVVAGTTTVELNEVTVKQIAAMVPAEGPCR